MTICVVQEVTGWLTGVTHITDALQLLHWHLPPDLLVLDNKIEADLFGDVQKSFNNFIKTGQAWAFLIGLVLGYMIKAFTNFG